MANHLQLGVQLAGGACTERAVPPRDLASETLRTGDATHAATKIGPCVQLLACGPEPWTDRALCACAICNQSDRVVPFNRTGKSAIDVGCHVRPSDITSERYQ